MSSSEEKSIFLHAIELESSADRAAYVSQACGSNTQLRKNVEALLASHEEGSTLLDGDATPQALLGRHVHQAVEALGLVDDTIIYEGRSGFDRTGETIQGFRLMEQLGEGGFGQVYVAQQQKPIRRMVAMKLLKPGMDSKEVLARFEAERQALALMNHPNIAQVYDAGATPQGQPYIVMELVRGIPITTFCRTKHLSLRERLELFCDVCRAVHHAHQRGVIHRDLKPSNVLVTLHDTRPVAKVIDFGVAKALHEPLTDKTIYTRFAQFIGTPMYMSPEQADMNALDVDTRSDVYSLGVLLYEILADTTPFDQLRMQSASFDEMRKMIREEEPPRPSLRLTTAKHNATQTQGAASADARELAGRLRGDLDWIVMKALDKDRRRRYDTAADLARDVDRYLSGQPVVARPPSPWYRFQKFAKRNKLVLTAASLVLLSLLVGTVISTSLAIKATRAQKETERLRQEAVDFAQRLKDANILLVSARANADQQRYPLAYDDYTRATELTPDHFLTWAGRGSLLATHGAWKAAASDYAKAIELGTTTNDPSWWGVPQLCYYAGEADAFDSICSSLEKTLQNTQDEGLATIAVRSLCIRPIDRDKAKRLADKLEEMRDRRPPRHGAPDRRDERRPPGSGPGPGMRNGGPGGSMFGLPPELLDYATALAHYRAGNFDLAKELLEPVLNRMLFRNEPPHEAAMQMSKPLLALVYCQLGESTKAAEMLDQALQSNEQLAERLATPRSSMIPWFDELESHLLLAEANQAITSQPLDESNLEEIENEALARLRP